MVYSFTWGIGIKANNQAEWWELWKGLDIAIGKQIKILKVMGDSMVVIRQISNESPRNNSNLSSIVHRITFLRTKFEKNLLPTHSFIFKCWGGLRAWQRNYWILGWSKECGSNPVKSNGVNEKILVVTLIEAHNIRNKGNKWNIPGEFHFLGTIFLKDLLCG